MKRDIIEIDDQKCTGCGVCVPNCHEGALQVIDGKVRLVSELMCDGLGACIGHCPEGAITIINREAELYNEGSCPGSRERVISAPSATQLSQEIPSELRHWPVQLHLINPSSPAFRDADLLLAADCVAFSLGSFHNKYLHGRSLAIGCPKLDSGTETYIEKLVTMIDVAKINTITVMIMEVPCCGGLLQIAKTAVQKATRKVPVKVVMVSIDGKILKEDWN